RSTRDWSSDVCSSDLTLWRALKLDEVLERLLPEGREAAPWATMAAVLVLARLCEPSSELHIAETWYRGTALEDLFALSSPLVNRSEEHTSELQSRVDL